MTLLEGIFVYTKLIFLRRIPLAQSSPERLLYYMPQKLEPMVGTYLKSVIRILNCLIVLGAATAHAENWPSWRGPRGDGTSLETNVPIHWSAKSNIVWKTAVPGIGHASPIVWNDRIFTVSCNTESEERVVLCFDRSTGKLVWQKTVVKSPLERKHALNSFATSTPATDGKLVYVAFLDRSEVVVAAYDFDGTQKWLSRPGTFSSMHGFGTAPLLFKDKVILNCDHDGDSYIVALDRESGKTVWKTPRLNHKRSYCTPLIRTTAGREQMVLSGDKCCASYDPNDGKLIWMLDGPTEEFVASPVYSAKTDLLYFSGGYPEHHIIAISPKASGKRSASEIKWRTNKGVAYVPSPIIEGDYFHITSDSGVAHCFDAATGKLLWQERTGEQHASYVSANGLIYFLNDAGEMYVVKPGPEYKLVAKNELGEKCFASPAISNGQMFIRGETHLYAIQENAKQR